MKKQDQGRFLPEMEAQILKDLYSGASLSDVMTPLLKLQLEAGLSGAMTDHLQKEKEEGEPNRRNGQKKDASERIRHHRDRNEPRPIQSFQ